MQKDERLTRLAQTILNNSVRLKQGEKVFIETHIDQSSSSTCVRYVITNVIAAPATMAMTQNRRLFVPGFAKHGIARIPPLP